MKFRRGIAVLSMRIALASFLILAEALVGNVRADLGEPPRELIVTKVNLEIPSYWAMRDVEIVAGVNTGDAVEPMIKQRFEAIVAPETALYEPDSAECDSYQPIVLVLDTSETRILHGIASSTYRAGEWIMQIVLENGVRDVGLPRDRFPQPTIVHGSEQDAQMMDQLIAKFSLLELKSALIDWGYRQCFLNRGENIVARYLDKGGDVNEFLDDGSNINPLGLVAQKGAIEIAEELIESGANVDGDGGLTPLYHAVNRFDYEMAKLLLEHGADPNKDKGDGWAPIHVAIYATSDRGDKKLVELLLAHGADVSLKTPSGLSPYEYAIEEGKQEIAQLIKAHGEDRVGRLLARAAEASKEGKYDEAFKVARKAHDIAPGNKLAEDLLFGTALTATRYAVKNKDWRRAESWATMALGIEPGSRRIRRLSKKAKFGSLAAAARTAAARQQWTDVIVHANEALDIDQNSKLRTLLSQAEFEVHLAEAHQAMQGDDLDQALEAVNEALVALHDNQEAMDFREEVWDTMENSPYFGQHYKILSNTVLVDGEILFLSLSGDGRTLIAGTEHEVVSWDTEEIWSDYVDEILNTEADIEAVRLNTSANLLAIGAESSGRVAFVELWNSETGTLLKEWPLGGRGLEDVMIRSDSKQMATLDGEGSLQVWDIADPANPVEASSKEGYTSPVRYSSDWEYVAVGKSAYLARNSVETYRFDNNANEYILTHVLEYGGGDLMMLKFSRDNSKLAIVTSVLGVEQNVHIYDLESGQQLYEYYGRWSIIALNEDFSVLAAADNRENNIEIFRLPREQSVRKIQTPSDVHSLLFSPSQANRLISGHENGSATIYGVDFIRASR